MRARTAVALAVLSCLAPIFASRYLPMVDLAQHAAQLAIWIHRENPSYFPEGLYRLNWFTPYLGAYLLARAFAFAVAVPLALKLTVAVACVAFPLSTLALIRASRGDAAFALAAAPLAFGVSFYSGFLNFLLAVPIAVLLVAWSLRHAESPSRGRGAILALIAGLLALSHAVAYGIGLVLALAAAWGVAGGARAAIRRSLPALAPLPFVLAWGIATWLGETHVRTDLRWDLWPSRPIRFPAVLLGSPEIVAGIAGLAILVGAFALLGVRLRRERSAWAAAAAATVLFLLLPDGAFHTVLLPERFAALVAILVLPALSLPVAGGRRRAAEALLVLLALGWSAHLAGRFRAFDREMEGFDAILAKMEPGKIVRVVPIDARSRAVPGYPMFWNVGAWYQVEKGGRLGFSFAQLFPVLVRYREVPAWAEPLWARRGELLWRPEDREVDYVVFRSEGDDPARLFPARPEPPVLLAREGTWWLFGATRP